MTGWESVASKPAVLPTGAWPRALSFHPSEVRVSLPSIRLSFTAGFPFGAVTVTRSATMTPAFPARSSSSVTAPDRIWAVLTVFASWICLMNAVRPSTSCWCRSPVVESSQLSRPFSSFRWSSVFMFCTACSPAASAWSRACAYAAESSCEASYQDTPPQAPAPAAATASTTAAAISGFLVIRTRAMCCLSPADRSVPGCASVGGAAIWR